MSTPEEYAEEIARAAFDARGQLEKVLGTPGAKPSAWYGMAEHQRAGFRIIAVAVARKILQLQQDGKQIPFKPQAKQAPAPAPKPETPSVQAKSVRASAVETQQPGPVVVELLAGIKASLDSFGTRMSKLEERVSERERAGSPEFDLVSEPASWTPGQEPEGPNGKPT